MTNVWLLSTTLLIFPYAVTDFPGSMKVALRLTRTCAISVSAKH